ncbi:MAG: hypothetical protein UU93_C0001G0119 [Candidatus Amesbacteria bacterium GW2011_GWA2_42_12]|uniref:Uncharacterized protein n=1 Tax=Candidatus Amesbacteria bacterium GW2011_GWA2_42_12 TaxID=1618356 RepID=A0A0G1B712_9BACT|nr:MAG: hypothetical protein UU93_C0001G0119 [Candidatus Amesbacteria bacterium GW2011_GWA2_42_12]
MLNVLGLPTYLSQMADSPALTDFLTLSSVLVSSVILNVCGEMPSSPCSMSQS